jgi:rhamnosyltransferase
VFLSVRLSIIIPTRNGAATLRDLFASLSIQTVLPDEMMVVDSSSSDETVTIAEQTGAKVTVIDPDEFDHGTTRTAAARRASGDIVLFVTQDVVFVGDQVVEHLIKSFTEDETIVATYARQLPAPGATTIASHLRLFNYPPRTEIRSLADCERLGLRTIFLSNSCAAYRKKALEKVGYFKENLIFGEDTHAAARLLARGGKIKYVADAHIYHSHNYTIGEEFRRYFDIGVFHQSESWLLKTYGGTGGAGSAYIISGIHYLLGSRNYGVIAEFIVRVAAKFGGYRLGRLYSYLPTSLAVRLSLNRGWWRKRSSLKKGESHT